MFVVITKIINVFATSATDPESFGPENPLYTYNPLAPEGYDNSKMEHNPVIENMKIIEQSTAEALEHYLNRPVVNLVEELQRIKGSTSLNGVSGAKTGFYNTTPNMEILKKYESSLGVSQEVIPSSRQALVQLIKMFDNARKMSATGSSDASILDQMLSVFEFYRSNEFSLKTLPNPSRLDKK